MFILNKKRICFVICALIVSTIAFQMNTPERLTETIETVALPVNNKVIILDAGHRIPR